MDRLLRLGNNIQGLGVVSMNGLIIEFKNLNLIIFI